MENDMQIVIDITAPTIQWACIKLRWLLTFHMNIKHMEQENKYNVFIASAFSSCHV